MRRIRADLRLVVGSVAVAAGVTVSGGFGWPELLFFAVMLTSLAVVCREGWRAWARERAARREAIEASRVRPERVAAAAVREERRRLSEDITAELRRMLTLVGQEAEHVEDAGASARRIHRHARLASSELRRLLGLLQVGDSDPEVADVGPDVATPRSRRDLAIAGAAGVLALAESLVYPRANGVVLGGWSIALTVVTAVTVVGRTRFPARAALVGAVSVGLAATAAEGVTGGFWMLVTVTGLVWGTVGDPGGTVGRTGPGVLFAVAVIASAWVHDQGNAAATTVVVSVILVAALVVQAERAREQRATRLAGRYRSSHAEAAAAAVEADRSAFAREIHDSVSHAVGVIAVQAAAAEVSARAAPEVAAHALGLVADVAAEALADLDRLRPDASPPCRAQQDVVALIDRIRAAGSPVSVSGLAELPPVASDLVYRLVQEALTNVVRHAHGAPARVTVSARDGCVTVRVADSGPGPLGTPGHGFGLVGLADRVRHAGGTFQAGSGPGHRGFVVEATVPVSGRSDS